MLGTKVSFKVGFVQSREDASNFWPRTDHLAAIRAALHINIETGTPFWILAWRRACFPLTLKSQLSLPRES
eukprot:5010057-Amphidinium_carterae.1